MPHPARLGSIMLASAIAAVAAAADPSLTSATGATTYTWGRAPVAIDPGVALTGTVVPTTIRVAIASGLVTGDVLACDTTGITGATQSYDPTAGVLALGGATTRADWQTLLRRVTFTSSDYLGGPRRVVFSIGSLVPDGDGHFHEFVADPGQTWSNARAAAAALTYQGVAGYLCTIDSGAENALLDQAYSGVAWIGASDDVAQIDAATGTSTFPNQAAADSHWYWVAGPSAGTNVSNGYATPVAVGGAWMNWSSGEPNDSGGVEHYGAVTLGGAGTWNDLPDASGSIDGYLVEYGGLAANDVAGLSVATMVSIGIDTLPDAPDVTISGTAGADLVVTLTATDADNDPLVYRVTPPAFGGSLYQCVGGVRGAAVVAANSVVADSAHRVVFAPAAHALGANAAVFYYSADDGLVSDLGFVSVDLVAAAPPPSSNGHGSWLHHHSGCGNGSGLAAIGVVVAIGLVRRRR